MTLKIENTHPILITTHGTDGACACALLLQVYPKADVRITSARRLPFTLEDILHQEEKPSALHLCGVGLDEDPAGVVHTLKALKRKRHSLHWYCGRGYLDSYSSLLHPLCKTVFISCDSNTEAVFRHLKLRPNEQVDLLRVLARQYVNPSLKRSEDHAFWHDLLAASTARYFKYEDRNSFVQAIQKLAGLLPLSATDRGEVEQYRQTQPFPAPLGDSPPMQKVRRLVQRMAPLPEPVLLLGPTGSGKEVVARLLHEASGRPGPFIAVNCAVLSTNSDLAHDRLFGHVSGAYTGAKDSQPGAFEMADRGTLFLDEVAELPLPVQTQLLRVLEEGTVTPLGTMKALSVQVRIIAATNQDIPDLVSRKQFRLDLLHRLNVLPLRIPSLQERPGDMKSIANHVIYELKQQGYSLRLSPADWNAILKYSWPGNIRQFINLLKRSAYLEISVREALEEETQNELLTDSSPSEWKEYRAFRPQSPEEVRPLEEMERMYMEQVLSLFEGNITHASQALGVSKNTLKKRLRK